MLGPSKAELRNVLGVSVFHTIVSYLYLASIYLSIYLSSHLPKLQAGMC